MSAHACEQESKGSKAENAQQKRNTAPPSRVDCLPSRREEAARDRAENSSSRVRDELLVGVDLVAHLIAESLRDVHGENVSDDGADQRGLDEGRDQVGCDVGETGSVAVEYKKKEGKKEEEEKEEEKKEKEKRA